MSTKYKFLATKWWIKHWKKRKQISTDWMFKYFWQWLKPNTKNKVVRVNKIFNVYDIAKLRSHIWQMADYDIDWFCEMFNPEMRGIKAWENGMFLNCLDQKGIEIKGKKILVLLGKDKLASFLREKGAIVSEEITDKSNEFDLVVAREFFDKSGWEKTKNLISKVINVTKNKGFIYMTLDFYYPHYSIKNEITNAFKWDKLSKTINHINDMGWRVNFNVEKQLNRLLIRSSKSNWKGRFFTTAALFGRVIKN